MNEEKTIDALNKLIEINNDRIEGYQTASKETEEHDLKMLFSALIATSEKCNDELIDEVENLDDIPTEGTKISGKFFRAWMDVKAALTGKDRKLILDSCEYGEDMAVATYDKVLKNHREDLSADQLEMIAEQRELIKADHDEVRSLRDALAEEKAHS